MLSPHAVQDWACHVQMLCKTRFFDVGKLSWFWDNYIGIVTELPLHWQVALICDKSVPQSMRIQDVQDIDLLQDCQKLLMQGLLVLQLLQKVRGCAAAPLLWQHIDHPVQAGM